MVYELSAPAPVQEAPTYDRLEIRKITVLLGADSGMLVEWAKLRGGKELGLGRTLCPLATLGATLETALVDTVYDALLAGEVIPPGGRRSRWQRLPG